MDSVIRAQTIHVACVLVLASRLDHRLRMDGRLRASLLPRRHHHSRSDPSQRRYLHSKTIPWNTIGVGYPGSSPILQHLRQEDSRTAGGCGRDTAHYFVRGFYCGSGSHVSTQHIALRLFYHNHRFEWMVESRNPVVRRLAFWCFPISCLRWCSSHE
jgi:hypothetical protein